MEWFKAFHAYITLKKQFQILVYEKSDFFKSTKLSIYKKK